MRDRVQYSPSGMITYKDLTWLRAEEADAKTDIVSIDLEKVPETPKKKKAIKQVAFIPWDRVVDFQDGEQREKEGRGNKVRVYEERSLECGIDKVLLLECLY